jgi:hypothetical protein
MVFAIACPPRETGKLLKHPETVIQARLALKLPETIHGIPEIAGHDATISRPTG